MTNRDLSMNDSVSENKTAEYILQADLVATNDLRNAIYNYEFKTINNLQILNGGGASILVGFLTHSSLLQTPTIKILFLLSILSFVLGLFFSLRLAFVSPSFLQSRYRKDEGELQCQKHKKYKQQRKYFLCCSSICFFIGVIFAIVSWSLST